MSLGIFRRVLFNKSLACRSWSWERSIHVFAVRNKNKEYDYKYDLDSLIQWKKETKMVFGSVRKLTKKGKIKKNKKFDVNVHNTLETLSDFSERRVAVDNPEINELNEEDFEKVGDDFDIPCEQTDHDQDKYRIIHVEESDRSSQTEFIEDGRQTCKILSVPTNKLDSSTGRTSCKISKPNANSGIEATKSRKSRMPVDSTFDGSAVEFEKGLKANKENNNKSREEWTEDGIFIPKINAVPSGGFSYSSKPQQWQTSSMQNKTQPKQSFSDLPFEPPESFEILRNIALSPFERSIEENEKWDNLIERFKQDIQQLSLRVMPSVKTVLSKTMPDLNRFFLNRWRENMINELGSEGFKQHQDTTIKRGVNLHANILEFLSGKPINEIQIMPDNEGHWASLQGAFSSVAGIQSLEKSISHPYLMYRGVVDCVASYKDMLCVIDWKTSTKPRPLLKNTYDDPLQVAAYIGAINSERSRFEKFGSVNFGVIVVGYADGSPAHIHVMDRLTCEGYWQDWTERLSNYYQLVYTEKMAQKK